MYQVDFEVWAVAPTNASRRRPQGYSSRDLPQYNEPIISVDMQSLCSSVDAAYMLDTFVFCPEARRIESEK